MPTTLLFLALACTYQPWPEIEGCAGADADGDGWFAAYDLDPINGNLTTQPCPEPDLVEELAPVALRDCDDADPASHPGQVELCNGRDDDCDGVTEIDADVDGSYVGCERSPGCEGTASDCAAAPDCDDADAAVWPGAEEACNLRDDDCDGAVDEDPDFDGDGDGWVRCLGLDCDDGNPLVWPGAPELCNGQDESCDGSPAASEADGDGDGFRACAECDDGDPWRYPLAPELCNGLDDNCDGALRVDEQDLDGDGALACDFDCNDADARRAPGFLEVCDGVDNDCDGEVDEGFDGDGDGASVCVDCDDGDPTVHPGAAEACNGADDDCDGLAGPGEGDVDGDGFLACADDCDDGLPMVSPAERERCDGLDNDCDGAVDDVEDRDGDGVGCGDCLPLDPLAFPGALERCDGLDDDCDGVIPASEVDGDGDRLSICEGDCDDDEARAFPGAAEVCDGVDNDCSGGVDEPFDADGDGWSYCGVPADCDDGDGAVFPGAVERCDGVDGDCDGVLLEAERDADGDRALACAGPLQDCDDADPRRSPLHAEVCDGVDDDCDGLPGIDELDQDHDGASACEGDCDDLDPLANLLDLDGDGQTPCEGDCDDLDPGLLRLDADGDGAWSCGDDCDDGDDGIHPAAGEACNERDDDCDGRVDEDFPDADGDWIADCIELCDGSDNDGDGAVDEGYGSGGDVGTWVDADAAAEGADGTALHPYATVSQAIGRSLTVTPCAILLRPGTHTEPFVLPDRPITVRGASGPAVTVLQPEVGPMIRFLPGAGRQVRVEGLTLRGGVAALGARGSYGGAVLIERASPTFSCVRFEENEAQDGGGAVAVFDGGPRFEGCWFEFNHNGGSQPADGGGALLVVGRGEQETEIAGSVFLDNHSTGRGGAVALHGDAWVNLTASEVSWNSSSVWGGGVEIDESAVVVDGLLAQANTAVGGGALALLSHGGDVVVAHLTAVENSTTAPYGSALWFFGSRSSVHDSILARNGPGGAMGWGADELFVQPLPGLTYLLLYDPDGHGLFSNFGPPVSDIVGTDGNDVSDPFFVAFDADGRDDDDLGLQVVSPARDAGRPGVLDADGSAGDRGATGGPTPFVGRPACVVLP